ncbi:unnamed protein product [Ectocarpus sp. 6 AP-2014]
MEASARATEVALSQRRREMDQAWDDTDQGWQELQAHMTEGKGEQPSSTWALGDLFEAEWDKRVPRDADGRIVLDESPICVKHLIEALLLRPTAANSTATGEADMSRDDQPDLFHHTARVLGLSGQLAPVGMTIKGGTTTFDPHEASKLTAVVQRWCPGNPGAACQDRCGDQSPPTTITFLRVKGRGAAATDCIIGGFSSIPWDDFMYDSDAGYYSPSPGAFLFMLKDGEGRHSGVYQSTKWGVKDGRSAYAVYRGQGYGPCFGEGRDLHVVWNGAESAVRTGNQTYDAPTGSPFPELNGCRLVDVETFRVGPKPNTPTSSTKQEDHAVEDKTGPGAPVKTADDVRSFGDLVADSLMEEEKLLQEAANELSLAKARTMACATAVAAVYGPEVATGTEDDVVELNVRGTRMTTLRSTLRICPDSALAAWFNEEQWPVAEKDLDSNGRRIIDCKPSVFSKVLDVLRIAKRAAWARSEEGPVRNEKRRVKPRVTIKAGDRAAFEEFVDMYFPCCETFMMEHVDLLDDI